MTQLGSREDAELVPKFYWPLHIVCAALRVLTFWLQSVTALPISISKFDLSATFTIVTSVRSNHSATFNCWTLKQPFHINVSISPLTFPSACLYQKAGSLFLIIGAGCTWLGLHFFFCFRNYANICARNYLLPIISIFALGGGGDKKPQFCRGHTSSSSKRGQRIFKLNTW